MADVLQATPHVLAWMDHIAELGHGRMSQLSATEAIAVSASSEGAKAINDDYFQNDHGITLGNQVSICAESFGAEPTVGQLVAATRTRYTLRREDPRAGVVHVHFPRVGYALRQELAA
jgi:glutathione S-transferase